MFLKRKRLFFWGIVFFYFILIFYKANLGIIDDYNLAGSFFEGRFLSFFIFPEIGRFFPLLGLEYNFVSLFLVCPVAFYTCNAFQFLLVVFLLFKILDEIIINNKLKYFLILIFILSPGFVTSWLRCLVAERDLVLFFVIFLYFYLKFQNNQKLLFLIVGLLSANIALYYKEPGFLMLGTFSFFHLIFGWKEINVRRRIFDFLLLFSSFIFIVVYYFVVYIHRGESLYGNSSWQPFFYSFSLFINYVLNNPLLFLNIIFFLWRCYCFFKKKIKFNFLYDSMSFAAIVYCLVYFKMRMFTPYYLLPAYVFALPALVYYFSNINWREKIFLKIASIATLLLVVCSSLPAGLYWFSFYKNIPHNYQKTLVFLEPYIKEKFAKGERTSIFLYGIYRNSNSEVYGSFRFFLCEYKKLPTMSFDLKTDIESNKNRCKTADSPYSFWNKEEIDKIEKGDLLIVTPYTYKNFYKDSFDDFETIFRTNSPIVIPDVSLRAIIKYFVSSYIHEHSDNPGMYSNKFLGLPQDFYVLRKIR